tara:strand:- start:999 stop:1625 length:627 start_codon:yes stop_codon:yes gene_type:complete
MPKPKNMPISEELDFITPGTVGKKLKIETFSNFRFGECDKNSESDFIDNINGRFNIYTADSYDSNGDYYLLILTKANNQLQVIKNGDFESQAGNIAKVMDGFLEESIIRQLIISAYDGDINLLSKYMSDSKKGICFEAGESEDVNNYNPCFFSISSSSHGIENCEIDSKAGTILFNEHEIQDLSELYGYVDEDEWGQVICVRVDDSAL